MSDYAKYVGGETSFETGKTYKTGYVYSAVINAALGAFFFGYVMSAFNPIGDFVQYHAFDHIIPDTLINFMTSFVPLGAGIGALSAGKIASSLGRRKAMLLIDVIALIGTGLTLITEPYSMVFGRLIQGFCVGANSSLVPLYISEVSPSEIAGSLGTVNQLLICIGVLVAPLIGLGMPTFTAKTYSLSDSKYYKILLGGAAFAPIFRLVLSSIAFTHETPKYLVQQNKDEEARVVLEKFYSDSRAQEELSKLRQQRDAQAEGGQLTMADVLSAKYSKRLIIGIMVAVFQQLSGINAIIFFSNKIFPEDEATVDTVIMDILQIVATVCAGLVIEKFGRRSLLISGMGISAIILGVFGISSLYTQSSGLKFLIWAYIFGFGFTIGPAPWIYIADILPDVAIGMAVLGNWVSTFIIGLGFPAVAGHLGMGGGFLVFAVLSAVGTVYMFFNIKETKGKSQAEIADMFDDSKQADALTFA